MRLNDLTQSVLCDRVSGACFALFCKAIRNLSLHSSKHANAPTIGWQADEVNSHRGVGLFSMEGGLVPGHEPLNPAPVFFRRTGYRYPFTLNFPKIFKFFQRIGGLLP